MVDTVVGSLVDGLTVCASMFCHQDTCGLPIHAFAANINNILLSYWLFTTDFLMNLSLIEGVAKCHCIFRLISLTVSSTSLEIRKDNP